MSIPPDEAQGLADISGHVLGGFSFPLLNQGHDRKIEITPGARFTGDGGDRNMRRF